MNKITRSLKQTPTLRNFLSDVIEVLLENQHIQTVDCDDTVTCGMSKLKGLEIKFKCSGKPMQITAPISNVGYVMYRDAVVESGTKFNLNLIEALAQNDTTPLNDAHYVTARLRYVMAEIIIETYPR